MRRFFACSLLCTSGVIRAWAQAPAPAPTNPAPPAGGATPAATPAACDEKIQLVGRVVEGTKVVNGVAETKGDTVRILDTTSSTAYLLPMAGGSFSASSDSTTGVFNAALADPLYQGQKIQIQEYDSKNAPATGCLDFTVPGLANWGRVRVDVAAGVVLSQDNQFTAATASGSTTQSTLFLDFQVEKNWKWLGVRPAPPSDSELPPAVAGQIYIVQINADLPGAVLPLDYSMSTLPSWLKITDYGLLYSPNPAALASSGAKVRITVTDALKLQTRSRDFLIRVQWPVVRLVASQTTTLPAATVGQMYNLQLEEDLPAGAKPPLTYSLTGNPPTWLNVDSTTGLLTSNRNPAASDATTGVGFTITVKDSASPPNTYPFPAAIAVLTQPLVTPPPVFPIHFEGFLKGTPKIGELESRWGFSSYFETRLTSIPVTTCQTAATTTGASGGTSGANACTTGTNTTTFLNSQKSAELIGGAYFPFVVQTWKWNNAPNGLFFAPIAKIGFTAPTGSTSATTQTTTTTGMTATATTQPVVPSQFYNFYTFGGRIGHLKLSNDRNSAPESMSYIDVGVGRFSNLTTLVPVYSNGAPLPGVTEPIRRWRVAVEGLLKIPYTPFTLGMNANLGQNLFAAGNNIPAGVPHTVQAAKDDLRFFIGVKFDLGNMLSKLQIF